MSRLDPDYLDLLEALVGLAENKNVDGFLTGYCSLDWRRAKYKQTPEHLRPELTCNKCLVISYFLVDGICPECQEKRIHPQGCCDICGDIAYLYKVEVKTYDQSMPLRQTGTQISSLCGDCIYDVHHEEGD